LKASRGGPGKTHTEGLIKGLDWQTAISANIGHKRLFGGLANFSNHDASEGGAGAIVLVITLAPKPGRFLGYVGDELIVTSRQPFLDGARALLHRGYDPATPYNMRHANSEVLSFVTTTIGHAAGSSVNADRTRFQKFIPFEGPIKEAAE
jgi:hypothetical protein